MLWPEDIDKRFNWPPGRARKLALKSKLPFYRLPDGSIRFELEEIQRLVKHVTPPPRCERCGVVLELPDSKICCRCQEVRR